MARPELPATRNWHFWKKEEVFHDGDSFFERLCQELSQARETVEFESYIFENDELGRRIVESLADAARRGVRVRVLIDGVGAPWFKPTFSFALQNAGARVKVYHPIPWLVPSRRTLKLFQKANRRNHRKVCIIDHQAAYVGGMNISAWHLKSVHPQNAWRDSGARVEGADVVELIHAFDTAWGKKRRRGWWKWYRRMRKQRQGQELVQLNNTLIRRKRYYRELLRRVFEAERRIWITSAYFVPMGSLIRGLRYAAMRGVDVRLLLPGKSDIFFMRWAGAAYYHFLLKAGVRVYEYLPAVLHAKTMLIDDWAKVGSSNLNHRSLIHDLEVDVVLTSPESRRSLEEQFLKDLAQSGEITHQRWARRPWYARLASRAVLLMRYWI